jgi:hypothetical protein
MPRAEEVFRSHFRTGDRADRTGYLRGTVKVARKMVDESPRVRLHAAQHRVPERAVRLGRARGLRRRDRARRLTRRAHAQPGRQGARFHGARPQRQPVKQSDFKGKTGRALVLPESRHSGLNGRGLRVRRPESRIRSQERYKGTVVEGTRASAPSMPRFVPPRRTPAGAGRAYPARWPHVPPSSINTNPTGTV